MAEPTQADRVAAIVELAKLCHEGGMIEGARLAIEAATGTVASCMFNSHGREQPELVKAIRALNPAQIVGDAT